MSERRARKERKQQPANTAIVKKPSNVWFNVLLVLLVAIVVAVGGYAVFDEYRANDPSMQTVAEYALANNTTFDSVKEQYGWSDEVTEDMSMEVAQGYTPITKVAESMGIEYEQFLAVYGLTENEVPKDALYKDVQSVIEEAAAKRQEEWSNQQNKEEGAQESTQTDAENQETNTEKTEE